MAFHSDRFSALSRRGKIALQLAMDALLIALSLIGAMVLRLESLAFVDRPGIWGALAIATLVALVGFWGLGLYRAMVRYVTARILIPVGGGALMAAAALYGAGLVLDSGLPRSVPVIFAVFVFLSVGGLRFVAREIFRNPVQLRKQPVIIYGAGNSGRQLANALFHGRDHAPVALVDDDPRLQRLRISGMRVHAPDQIPRLAEATGARIVLLAIPSLSRARRREILEQLEQYRLEIRTIPDMSELITGKARISELRAVSPEDLLGRDPVAPDPGLLARTTAGKVVMVTGAGGSIGSELCRQVLGQKPAALVLFEVSEFALYTIEAELGATAARLGLATRIVPVLGSVQHSRRLEATIRAFGVQTIYHAAAYKHVPLVEENIVEGVRNNIFGTLSLASAARRLGVGNVILISTDKAVRPTNIMGATKRVAELICQAQALESTKTVFSMVRFGNVLGSSGSVIPRFRAQIERGGPVTVTHRDVTRYFMTIPEAAQLVIQAGAMARGGDVFVLDMGEPVRILDLAESMVRLHGLTPYLVDDPGQIQPERGDIPICITGLRKGEKLFEELLIGDNPAPTQHPRIMTASEVTLPLDTLEAALDRLLAACERFDVPEIITILRAMPLGYTPRTGEIPDLLWEAQQASDPIPTPAPEQANREAHA
ncbi:MAG: polysaccharide biosynthesis protein [Roseovarius sp.]|nr:polysaccharide biosynthesis protein [Roseovarius sp.]